MLFVDNYVSRYNLGFGEQAFNLINAYKQVCKQEEKRK